MLHLLIPPTPDPLATIDPFMVSVVGNGFLGDTIAPMA